MIQPVLRQPMNPFVLGSFGGTQHHPRFLGQPRGEDEFVTQRDIARDETAALLEERGIPAILAERFDATLWHILRAPTRSDSERIVLTLDRRDNDTIQRLAQDSERLAALKEWLTEEHPELLPKFEEALNQSEASQDPRAISRWLQVNQKAIGGFIEEHRQEFSQELSQWLDEHRNALTDLFAKALKVNEEDISLRPRQVDTCCLAQCTSCLRSRPQFRKTWIG